MDLEWHKPLVADETDVTTVRHMHENVMSLNGGMVVVAFMW
jgi:hypothetical protein